MTMLRPNTFAMSFSSCMLSEPSGSLRQLNGTARAEVNAQEAGW